MIEEVRPSCPALRAGDPASARRSWDALVEAGRGGDRAELARLQAELSPDDPINIQYTSGTTGFPKGATLSHHNILNNGYFVGTAVRLHARDDRVCIPVPFYHCFGMVMGNLGVHHQRRHDGHPRPRVRPEGDAARPSRRSAARRCTACRRCSSPSSTTPTSTPTTCRSLRTGIMAGSPCPVEVMKQVVDRMGMTEVTICYGMTETSPGVHPDPRRRLAGAARRPPSAGCTRTSRSRSSTRRPG